MTIDAYPLTWPHPQPRTEAHARTHAAFKVDTGDSISHLVANLRMLNTRQVIISSNVPTKRDGLPYADFREPTDPGVAVYFDRYVKSIPDPASRTGGMGAWRPFVLACDHYTKFRWNLRAIGMTVEALRTIARHGASSMLEQAFTGFAALPPRNRKRCDRDTHSVVATCQHRTDLVPRLPRQRVAPMKPWPLLLLCSGCIGAPFETGSEFEGLSIAPDASADAGSSSSSTSTSSTSASSSSTTTTDPPSSAVTPSSSSSASTSTTITTIIVSTVTPTPTCGVKYAQCGGSGWSGITCCQPGLTCTVGNFYFSQCQ